MNKTTTHSNNPTNPARQRFVLMDEKSKYRLLAIFAVLVLIAVHCNSAMLVMPGKSHIGPLPELTSSQAELAANLRDWITVLADNTGGVARAGNRNANYPARFKSAADWISAQLRSFGCTHINTTSVERDIPAPNIEVTIPGTTRPNEILVVGAHYDAYMGSPGADDNASGVAACLHFARIYQANPLDRTLRIVFFVNEEPPAFQQHVMGSMVYAKACKNASDNIIAMMCVESIGYYSDKPGSQKYPSPMNRLYPDTGDFIAFVSNYSSRQLNKHALSVFRTHAAFPSQGACPPGWFEGAGWSDHWSFWQHGYKAFMVTDTAAFRNPFYHTPQDAPPTLDYERTARVVEGLKFVIDDLGDSSTIR